MTGTLCTGCDRLLPLSSFLTRVKMDSSSMPYVYRKSRCRECERAYGKDYSKTPTGKEASRRWHRKNLLLNKEAVYRRKKTYYNPVREKDKRLQKTYGITLLQMEKMLADQGGRCAVCRCSEPNTKGLWVVDHNHTTGRVRGVLCGRCNSMIGYSTEVPFVLMQAIDYLLKDMSFFAKPSTVTYGYTTADYEEMEIGE